MKHVLEVVIGFGLLFVILALAPIAIFTDRSEGISRTEVAAPVSAVDDVETVESIGNEPGSQFSFGNYIDTDGELIEIDTAALVSAGDSVQGWQYSFGNYIDIDGKLVEIDTGAAESNTPARIEAATGRPFSFMNYIDTGSELVEIDTGAAVSAVDRAEVWQFSFGNYIDTGRELIELDLGR